MEWLDKLLGKKSLMEIANEAVAPYGVQNFKFDESGDDITILDSLAQISLTLSKANSGFLIDRSHGSSTDYEFDQNGAVKAIESYFDVA